MKPNVDNIENNLYSYLDRFGATIKIIQFRRVYLHLVLIFKDELTTSQLEGALELQKHLRDEQYDKSVLDGLEKSSHESLNKNLKDNASMTREALLNQLLFGALLESEETDFFYVAEPIFLFVKEMKVGANELEEILISEFAELKEYE